MIKFNFTGFEIPLFSMYGRETVPFEKALPVCIFYFFGGSISSNSSLSWVGGLAEILIPR